jgi:hypothetical protein
MHKNPSTPVFLGGERAEESKFTQRKKEKSERKDPNSVTTNVGGKKKEKSNKLR